MQLGLTSLGLANPECPASGVFRLVFFLFCLFRHNSRPEFQHTLPGLACSRDCLSKLINQLLPANQNFPFLPGVSNAGTLF